MNKLNEFIIGVWTRSLGLGRNLASKNLATKTLAVRTLATVILLAAPSLSLAEISGFGLFVEPALTLESGSTVVQYPAPFSNSTGSVVGFGLGARVGFHFNEALFAGLDARYSVPHFKDSSVQYDSPAQSTSLGPVVGVQIPLVGLRVWGSYILAGSLDPAAGDSIDVKFNNASGFRIGTGFRLLMLSLNLEYQELKYGQTQLEKIGPYTSGSALDQVSASTKSWIASVSMPFEF